MGDSLVVVRTFTAQLMNQTNKVSHTDILIYPTNFENILNCGGAVGLRIQKRDIEPLRCKIIQPNVPIWQFKLDTFAPKGLNVTLVNSFFRHSLFKPS